MALRHLRRQGKPRVIYTAHGFHFYKGGPRLRGAMYRTLERWAGRWTDYLVVINREDEEAARRYGIVPAERVRYMPGIGVDTRQYSATAVLESDMARVRQDLGLGAGDRLFLMVAEFIARKRHRDALHAFAQLQRPDVCLALAGVGPQLEDMKQLAARLGIADRVRFLGFRRDVPALIQSSVATLLPSEQEGLPRSVLESLCQAVPVIGSRIRGVADRRHRNCQGDGMGPRPRGRGPDAGQTWQGGSDGVRPSPHYRNARGIVRRSAGRRVFHGARDQDRHGPDFGGVIMNPLVTQPTSGRPPLGFLILTHDNPPQLMRLVRRLNAMFGAPPIVCHHDFSKCRLDTTELPANVSFVRPHLVTARGRWSVVEATVAGLRVLHERDDAPEWVTLLSGADYPIKTADVILAEVTGSPGDAFVEYISVDPEAPQTPHERRCAWRYFRRHIELPSFIQRYMPFSENRALPAWFPQRSAPFTNEFQCYAGSQFFTANRRSVRHLLDWYATRPALANYYYRARVPSPEESYFQCVWCNEPSLRVMNDNKRYVDWSPGTGHPKTLTLDDLPLLVKSTAHFARKIEAPSWSASTN
jgi:hypothetical protein